MTARLLANPLPAADLFDLTRRLRGRDGTPAAAFQPTRSAPPDERVGSAADFWIYDFDAKRNVRAHATVRVLTEHAKWWVADGITVDAAGLQTTADAFETKLYPTDRRLYGSEWSPGIDADPRVNVLVARIPGRAAGYFSSADELPLWVNEFSAEREMIYVNALAARFGTDNLSSVLAHEFCHMIQFNKRKRSVVWFQEGHAQLCERANGFATGFEQSFLRQPDTQLNDWPELDADANLHYGGAFMFLEFMRQHAGGEDLLNALLAHGVDTPADVDAVLRARGQPPFDELFADFVAANALIGSGPEDRYAYTSTRPLAAATATSQDRVAPAGSLRATAHDYAARYVELPREKAHVSFTGARTARVIPTDPHSGSSFWWSDRADTLDSTLTRTVDLRSAHGAAMTFWTWYEIEPDFDYLYVAASTDGGKRWTTLVAPATTTADPNGNNLGNGFTGNSAGAKAPQWIQQRVDLSAYDGKEVQLRFEYVTDGALNMNGAAIDDVEIPGVLKDDAEADNGWTANGFIRSTNVLAQRFVVQLIRFPSGRPTVERFAVAGGAALELDVDASGDRKPPLLAVTPLAPRSSEPVPFEVKAVGR